MDRATVERRPKPSLARLGHAARRFAAIGRLGVGSIRGSFYAGAAAALVLVCAAQGWPGAAHAQTNDAPQIDSTGPFAVVEGSTVVATLSATDPDTASDLLVWSIPTGLAGGADADKFTLSSSGVLTFEAGKDYESPDDADADGTYGVVVQVSDGTNTDSADLIVTLGNVVELDATISGPDTVSFAENGATRVATFTASSDVDRDGIEWTISGSDADHFTIDSPPGALRFHIDPVSPNIFAKLPDFEDPDDSDTNNSYWVTLQAAAGSATTTSLTVTVTVTDSDETGALRLDTARPSTGTALTATLTDPDDVTAGTAAWQWERSTGPNAWTVISGAASATYTPAAADTNAFLRVTATYDDEHGTGHSVHKATANVVTGPLLTALRVSTGDATANSGRAMNPAFTNDTLHYAVGCAPNDTMSITLSAPSTARVAIDGMQAPTDNTAVDVAVTSASDVAISVTDAQGAETVYWIHCLEDVFYQFGTVRHAGAEGVFHGLLMFRHGSHLVLLDNDGVPRHRKNHSLSGLWTWFFRVDPDGAYRYAFPGERTGSVGSEGVDRIVVLNEHLHVIDDEVQTSAPLRSTDRHAFAVLPNGNYLLISYEPPVARDLSHLTFSDPNGVPYGSAEDLIDSAIQIRTPAGDARFTWNSWGKMPLEDCVQHRFAKTPFPGYAHLNSIQMEADLIIGSFRGCSKVLAIDTSSGEVAWRLGRTNLSDEEWASRGLGPAPLVPVNDPEGEFCGQHSAVLLPNGNLLLYDNGSVCLIDPRTRTTVRTDNVYSRAVEYALDHDAGEAVFVRDHSLHGSKTGLGYATGQVVPMDNGDWLVSWGRSLENPHRPLPDGETVTQVDPATGQEKFAIRFTAAQTNRRPTLLATEVPADALAPRRGALEASFPASEHTSIFHTGADDSPQVVVAFNQPVVDFEADTPSIEVSGATVAEVGALAVPGEQAYAYLLTLAPEGEAPVTVRLVTGRACDDGGICTADGSVLSTVPTSRRVLFSAPPVIESDTTFDVDENTNAVATLRARDPDTVSSRLVWSIPSDAPGADGTEFELSARGVLSLAEGKDFEAPDDADGDGTYEVRVQVSDGDSTADALLEVNLANVNEAPAISGPETVAFDENDTRQVTSYTATDPERAAVGWDLSGPDRLAFSIADGVLRFTATPDFEARADTDHNNVFEVTVEATDGTNTGELHVSVNLANVNEAPAISGPETVAFDENDTRQVTSYTATDPERAAVGWDLSGPDRLAFSIADGVLRFTATPDFEARADTDHNNVFEVTVEATDGTNTGELHVSVSLANVNEPGSVTMSSAQPETGRPLVASIEDPDGETSIAWSWASSGDLSNWTVIIGASSAQYQPRDPEDVGASLRATARYEDGHGSQEVSAISARPVRRFSAGNVAPMFPTSESGRRSIDESAPPDSPVGDPVSATDSPGEPLAYSLIGDPGPFVIEEASGQLRTSAPLDYESQPQHRHTVTVSVRDPSGESDTVALTIDVVDVNEAPLVSGDAVASFEENDTDAVASFTAVDPEGDAVTWRARGIDGDRFEITAGVLRFESPPDYDAPTDSGRDDTYDVIVEATDSDGLAGALPIAVNVTGVNELPEITGPSTPNAANNSTAAVATYVAADPERGAIGWDLSGDDRDFFSIDRGVLRFRRAPSFQMPRDRDTDNNYDVVLEATDGIHTARKEVKVTVTKTTSPPRRRGGGGGGGGPPVVVEIDGASFAAAVTETVFTAAVSDDARIGSLSWTVTGPDGFTATSDAERFSFVAPAGGDYTLSVTVDDTARRTLTGRVTLTVFGDITGHQFVNEILWLAEEGITRGCAAHSYCPSNPVTRAQMATFLARALNLEAPRQRAGFADVDPFSAHAANIEALYAAQITTGCTQDPLAYCPSRPVTRAQMATFLARALDLEAPAQPAGFADVDPFSAHAANIEALYAAQITTGCTQDPLAYCPSRPVTRAQMAAFLHRALRSVTGANSS